MARFSDDDVTQWISDLAWVSDDGKVCGLLVDVFTNRTRVSNVQARLWKRVIDLYWRAGWTKREIAEQFGVSLENVRRIVKSLRREAAIFFGQSVQPVMGQSVQSETPKAEPPRKTVEPVPIVPDPAN